MAHADYNTIRFHEIDSTNSYALSSINSLPHHSVIVADKQLSGHGRHGRCWVSDSVENLYKSIIIRPDRDYQRLPLANFTQLFSVIIADIIADMGLCPVIKWPNDILVDERKVCGILSEVSFSGSLFNGIVVGFGINIVDSPISLEDQPYEATSLHHELNKSSSGYAEKDISKEEVLDRILNAYQESYTGFLDTGFAYIRDAYLKYFPFLNQEVSIVNSNTNVSGKVCDISLAGELVVDDFCGNIHTITLGDMEWKTCCS